MSRPARQPIIVIGMHRSGTSVLTRSLERLGLFLGNHKDPNHEALFFLRLNRWILQQSGGSWDHPAPVRDLIRHEEVSKAVIDHLTFSLKSPGSVSFLGWRFYFRYRRIDRLDIHWGWKDPRNTFTLPLWLKVFPEARIVYIERHGADVANSLLKRQEHCLAQAREVYNQRKPIYALLGKRKGFTDSIRCATLEGGFSLWEEYVSEARKHLRELGGRALEIRYEDLVLNAVETVKRVASFCGLDPSNDSVVRATRDVDPRYYCAVQPPSTKRVLPVT